VKFEGDATVQKVNRNNMREGAPTRLSLEEKKYWVGTNPELDEVPESVLNVVPKIPKSKQFKIPPSQKL
jgi:hypothetical protein